MRGLEAGQSVTLRHVEVLEPDGTIATRTLRRGQQCDIYTSNGTDAWWEPRFAMHGFRYAQIEATQANSPPRTWTAAYTIR
mgnify:CR=1 FL=1